MKLKNKNYEDIVFQAIERHNNAASLLWLAKNLSMDKTEVKKALHALLKKKKITRLASKLYGIKPIKEIKEKGEEHKSGKGSGLAAKFTGLMEGRIDAHPDGYAFFIPDRGEDLFVPSTKLKGALHGDRVLCKLSRFRGKPEAHVVEIIERNFTTLVGRVEVRKRSYLVIPFHRKFTQPLYVHSEAGSPVYAEGDVVQCEITRYPDNSMLSVGKKFARAEGKILSRLGHIDDKGIENPIVMSKYGLTQEAPEEVLAQASKQAALLPQKGDNPGRHEMRDLFTVTIDGETARDFDDAIGVKKHRDGYSLYVHIADVAHYVRPGTLLDADAYARGTSVYFPEFAIPMLPEVLSNGVCSLRPDEDRFALSVRIEYDRHGQRKKTHYYQSVIRSSHRLTYTYVNAVLAGEKPLNEELGILISEAHELMQLIHKRRLKNGMIDFELPDVDFIFDDSGDIVHIQPEERGISERIIEHFMIEANEVVAELLAEKAPNHQAVFRNHARPDYMKIEQWSKNARKLGVDVGRLPEEITGDVVQKWFDEIAKPSGSMADKPYSYLLKSMLVRSMQRAEYAAENIGHFGLASDYYTHFTSPIRRYPDLIVHRLLKKYQFGADINLSSGELAVQAKHCSARERNAEDAEREVHLYKKLAYLRNNPGTAFNAYINRVVSSGFYVFLTELLMTGYIDASVLPKGRYDFDTDKGAVYNRRGSIRYRLGESLDVQWISTNMDKLEADFMLAE